MTNSPQDADCFNDWTHPSNLDVKDSSWVTFAKELDEACLSIFPKNPPQYTGVHALLLNWSTRDRFRIETMKATNGEYLVRVIEVPHTPLLTRSQSPGQCCLKISLILFRDHVTDFDDGVRTGSVHCGTSFAALSNASPRCGSFVLIAAHWTSSLFIGCSKLCYSRWSTQSS